MLERDQLQFRTLKDDPTQKYYVYCPSGTISGVVVSVHGISLNAASHAELLAPFAAKYGAILVAPLFDKERYWDYNTLGFQSGNRADLTFDRIMQEVSQLAEIDISKIYLCGYSGGAQFAHRYAMCYPERIQKLVLCSPGYYTMPDDSAYPFGIGGIETYLGTAVDLDAFLSLPILLTVGENDILRNTSLLQTEELDRVQGMTRVARAKKWFSEIESRCVTRNIKSNHKFVLLPGVGHGFEASMEKAKMGQEIFSFLRIGRELSILQVG